MLKVLSNILKALVLCVFSVASFAHEVKVVIAVSANDCIHCTLVLDQILQNVTHFDTVIVFFDSKEHKKLVENKFKEVENLVFEHKNPLDTLLIAPGFSSVHVYTKSSYQRMLLKNITSIKQLIDPRLKSYFFSFDTLEVEPNSFLIASNGQATVLYNKYRNTILSAWHKIGSKEVEIKEKENPFALFDFQTIMNLFEGKHESDIAEPENEPSFEKYISNLTQLGLPSKNVQSIAIVGNRLLLFTQLYLQKAMSDKEEIQLQPYDFIYIFELDFDKNELKREKVIPIGLTAQYKDETAFLINSFSKHQLVNSDRLFSSAYSMAGNHLKPFDPHGVGIVYDVDGLLSKSYDLLTLTISDSVGVDVDLLSKTHAKNSLFITDGNSFNFLYNRALNISFDLSPKGNDFVAIGPNTMISKITGNRLNLNILKIFACEVYRGKLMLCILSENQKLKLIEYNLKTEECNISDVSLPGIMAFIGFNNGQLIHCGIDASRGRMAVYVYGP